jgi:hypothetical protein
MVAIGGYANNTLNGINTLILFNVFLCGLCVSAVNVCRRHG